MPRHWVLGSLAASPLSLQVSALLARLVRRFSALTQRDRDVVAALMDVGL